MGRQEDVVRGVLANTVNSAELESADREGVQVPPPLSGQLGAARAAAARPRPVAPTDMPLSFGSIIARNVVPWYVLLYRGRSSVMEAHTRVPPAPCLLALTLQARRAHAPRAAVRAE